MASSLLGRASQAFHKPIWRSLVVRGHSPKGPSRRFQSGLAIAKKVKKNAEEERPNAVRFDSMKNAISKPTLDAITNFPLRLTTTTPVQEKVLSRLPGLAEPFGSDSNERQDLLVRAKTGTGKTIAFLTPAVEARIKELELVGRKAVVDSGLMSDHHIYQRARKKHGREAVGTLILSPTRELATQIANEAVKLTQNHPNVGVRLLTGGTNKRFQMRDWMKHGRDIVVATTGRLRDLMESEADVKFGIKQTQLLILDEADTMLDMGFRDDIEAIRSVLLPSPQRQTFMFSATISPTIRQVASSVLSPNYDYIDCVPDDESPVHAHIPQYHTVLPSAAHQIPHLMRLLAHDQLVHGEKSKVIVFLPTTKMTQLFATIIRNLSRESVPFGKETTVLELHSKRTMDSRVKVSDQFRKTKNQASVLVTSDISARGVDYPGVTRVVQVGIPASTEQYIHRVGRTGRAGTSGRADIVLLPWEIGFVTWQLTKVPLKPLTTSELQSQMEDLAEKYDGSYGVTSKHQIKPFTPVLSEFESLARELAGMFDPEAVRETFLSLLGYYFAKSPELRVDRNVILEGCKTWTVEAGGQRLPPYVSDKFLAQLGFTDGRTKYYGHERTIRVALTKAGDTPWSGRGMQKLKGRVQSHVPVEYDSPEVQEYRGQRFVLEKYGERKQGFQKSTSFK